MAGQPGISPRPADWARLPGGRVTPSSICSILDQFDIAHPDAGQRRLGIDHAKRTVDFAAGMGCPTVILTPTRYGKFEPLTNPEDELETGAQSMEEVADYAAGCGVNLLYRSVGPL